MPVALDLTNKTFGRLSVIKKLPERNEHGKVIWECLCNPELGGCGSIIPVQTSHLNSGSTRSCGCLAIEVTKATNTKHGYTKFQEYKIWNAIKRRCYNEKDEHYPSYGGRGIMMADEWRDSFANFYRDMGPRPSDKHSIDRERNNEGYHKGNCRWVTSVIQANNRRTNIIHEYKGETKTLAEWCRILNLNYTNVFQRMNKLGLTFEEAINPTRYTAHTLYTLRNITKTLSEWCREYFINLNTAIYRLYRSWSIEEALTPIESKQITFSTTYRKEDEETHTLEWWCGLLGLEKDKTYLRILRGESFEDIVKES